MIVDDGSSDNTRQLVNSFIDENKIDIRYIYQKNSGKHIAFNTGVTNAKYNLFMCIDSDDFLVDDILCEIINTWKMVKKIITHRLFADYWLIEVRIQKKQCLENIL